MAAEGESIGSVERTLTIVEFLRDRGEASLSTISSEPDYTMSTTYRHLKTLVERGYLIEGESGYRLSLQFLELGQFAQSWRPEYELAAEKVRELAAETNERVQFIAEENGWAVYVHQRLGDRAVETDTYPGKRVPIHASAAGLAILSELPTSAPIRSSTNGGSKPVCPKPSPTARRSTTNSSRSRTGDTASTTKG